MTRPQYPWFALAADVSVVAFLAWGLAAAPDGIVGVVRNDDMLRVLLGRVVAVLAVALCGTWLAVTDQPLGAAFLIGSAVAGAFTIPSAFWGAPAILLSVAGAHTLARTLPAPGLQRDRHALEALGLILACGSAVALAPCAMFVFGLGQSSGILWLTVALALLPVGTLSITGAAAALSTTGGWRSGAALWTLALGLCLLGIHADSTMPVFQFYQLIPGARSGVRLGDTTIPIPPPVPQYAMTPVAAASALKFSTSKLDLVAGQPTTISLELQSNVPVDAIGFDIDYDPTILTVDDLAVGKDMVDQATAGGLGVLTLPGIVADSATNGPRTAALSNAGVGILTSGHTETVGPTSGTVGVLTLRALHKGSTQLALKSVTLYSWVDGIHRHHQTPALPAPLHVSVAN